MLMMDKTKGLDKTNHFITCACAWGNDVCVVCVCVHIYQNYSCLSVSVMEGQRKQFDLETLDTVSLAPDRKELQLGNLCECQSGTNYGHKH